MPSPPLSPLTPPPPSPSFSLANSIPLDPDPLCPDASLASPPLRGKEARQNGSHRRRAAKKHRAHEETGDCQKDSTKRHVADAMANVLEFDIDSQNLPVNSTGFGGLRRSYVKDKRDADTLCAQPGWRHLCYKNGQGSIPLVDRKRRMIACIGGTPKDVARWTSEVVC